MESFHGSREPGNHRHHQYLSQGKACRFMSSSLDELGSERSYQFIKFAIRTEAFIASQFHERIQAMHAYWLLNTFSLIYQTYIVLTSIFADVPLWTQSMADNRPTFKFIVIGNSGVGKTAILKRLIDDVFVAENQSTIGVEFLASALNIDGQSVKLHIFEVRLASSLFTI
jgi:hypothetical protein